MQGAVGNFDRCVDHVLDMERGYVNHPNDPGKATNHGIKQGTLDDARILNLVTDLPRTVDHLTRQQAIEIYRHHFWVPIRGAELPTAYALITLDAAANHGPTRAVRWLQHGLGVTADGWIGTRTVAAANTRLELDVISEALARRTWFYMMQDDIDEFFGLGWARRLFFTNNAAVRELRR